MLPSYGDRPRLHVRPDRGWLNDPNGPVVRDGRLHLFFQHNPAAAVHGDICWGHAVSDDLVTWRLDDLALRPTPGGPDAAGCWSGCAVVDGDDVVAVYTGVRTGPHDGSVCLAVAEDAELRHWRKTETPAAVPPPGIAHFRDPFVFSHEGRRLAVVGAGTDDGHPVVLLYDATDLHAWRPLGELFGRSDTEAGLERVVGPASVWECPQLVAVDDRWVLVVSRWYDDVLGPVGYVVGDLVPEGEGLRFESEACGLVDHGHDFYAPAVLATPDGPLLWGWSWEDRDQADVDDAGWAGALTLTRRLALAGDRLVSRPVDALADLRGAPLRLEPGDGFAQQQPVDLVVELPDGSGIVHLGALTVAVADGVARVEREVLDPERRGRPAAASVADGPVTLRVVIDGPVVEVYVEGGPCFTERVYAGLRAPVVTGAGATWTAYPLG